MHILIANPAAGDKRRHEGLLRKLTDLLSEHGIEWQILRTERSGDGTRLALEALQRRAEAVIAVGGDGTLGEIANGMKNSGTPLLFASCGTGNDFIKTAKLPKDPLEALAAQLRAPRSAIDLGRVNDRCFINVAGTGLDVDVLVEAEKYKADYTGLKPYLKGVADAVRGYQPVTAQLSYDGEELHEATFTILSIGNGQYIGGGMRAVPGAKMNDGIFDVIEVHPVRRWSIPVLMGLFITGLHAKTKLARRHVVQKLRIVRPGMVLNLDGELIPCDDAEFEVLPGALTVQLPCLANTESVK